MKLDERVSPLSETIKEGVPNVLRWVTTMPSIIPPGTYQVQIGLITTNGDNLTCWEEDLTFN